MQDYFKETYGRETHFIPNGVNRPQIREASLITDKFGLKKDSYILFLGRLVPEKGIRYLVEAFKNVKTDKKLVIAGGSSDTDSFMEELKELAKGDDRILFTGFVQGAMLDELYSNAYMVQHWKKRYLTICRLLWIGKIKTLSHHGMQEKQSVTVRCVDIEDLEKQAEAIRVEQIKLYESYADGVLLRDAYIEKKKVLSEKLAALQDSIRTEKEEQECADELDEEIRALTKQASEKTYIGGLTKECVDAFVSMVYLYDDQTMKIEFNCEDVIRRALEKYGA